MLPEVNLPTYELKIPSNGKTIKVRPFLVKEEKLLLMAVQSGDESDIINTTKQIIRNCIIEGDVDIDKLPFFDIDYLFIALRAKSIGESVDVRFTCNNLVNGVKCGNVFPAKIDVSKCEVKKNDKIENEIMISGQIKVKMKYPTYSVMKSIMDKDDNLTKKIKIIAGSIDYLQEKDKVYSSKDLTKEEMIAFIESLTQDNYKKLENYVDNFPTFVIKSEADCEACGFHHDLEYTEFTSFFV